MYCTKSIVIVEKNYLLETSHPTASHAGNLVIVDSLERIFGLRSKKQGLRDINKRPIN